MAHAGAKRLRADQDGVGIAIGADLFHHQAVTRGLALEPKFAARTAVESHKAGCDGLAKGFLVHVSQHQNPAGSVVLNHRRRQSIGLLKVQSHCESNKKARHFRGGRPFHFCVGD
jgi:hypothetical protein